MAQDPALADLRAFVHLSSSLRFARTSEACHVSPSALSRAIARLERQVGRQLFERDQRTVSPTPFGARMAEVVGEMLERWDGFHDGGAESGDVVGALSLYCTVTASQSILPEVLHEFRERHPAVRIDLETGDAADALTRLADGVDVAVAAIAARLPPGVRSKVIARTPLVAVAPTRALPDRIDWNETPFVLPSAGAARTLVDAWLRRHGRTAVIAAEAAGHEAVLSLVTLGCGVGIVPELVVAKSPLAGDLTVLRSRPKLPDLAIAVCTLPERLRRAPVRALWETLDEVASER